MSPFWGYCRPSWISWSRSSPIWKWSPARPRRGSVPFHESYMGRALMSGARTGEMIGVAGPAALMAGLSAAGFKKEDVPRLGRIVLEHIRPIVGNEVIEKFLAGAPALKG